MSARVEVPELRAHIQKTILSENKYYFIDGLRRHVKSGSKAFSHTTPTTPTLREGTYKKSIFLVVGLLRGGG